MAFGGNWKDKGEKPMDKLLNLFEDWAEAQGLKKRKKIASILEKMSKNPAHFQNLIEEMGSDGTTFRKLFNENKSLLSEDSYKAKRKLASFLLENSVIKPDDIKLGYEPITDRSKSMSSYIEGGTPSGAAAEIIRAITGGNMLIAAALTKASWGQLTLGDRNAIMNIAMVHSGYNRGSEVQKDSGNTVFYTVKDAEPMEKKSDMTANEFIAKAFPMSDPKNTRLYKDE